MLVFLLKTLVKDIRFISVLFYFGLKTLIQYQWFDLILASITDKIKKNSKETQKKVLT